MRTLIAQKTPEKLLKPMSVEDAEQLDEYHINQPIAIKITGMSAKKERSYKQLCMYMACCKKVADNSDTPEWSEKRLVDYNCRMGCRYIDEKLARVDILPDGTKQVRVVPDRLNYENCDHKKAVQYMEKAFPFLADRLGVPVEQLKRYSMEE